MLFEMALRVWMSIYCSYDPTDMINAPLVRISLAGTKRTHGSFHRGVSSQSVGSIINGLR